MSSEMQSGFRYAVLKMPRSGLAAHLASWSQGQKRVQGRAREPKKMSSARFSKCLYLDLDVFHAKCLTGNPKSVLGKFTDLRQTNWPPAIYWCIPELELTSSSMGGILEAVPPPLLRWDLFPDPSLVRGAWCSRTIVFYVLFEIFWGIEVSEH